MPDEMIQSLYSNYVIQEVKLMHYVQITILHNYRKIHLTRLAHVL